MADPPSILGEDPAFLEVEEQISRLAAIDRPCLVIGERGTGKELLATRLHYLSPRWDGPLVKVNCAALAESLLDTELFGHEAGAFTGAQRQHVGRFERADGGTLLLDEIASAFGPPVQEKVLRVIEYGEMERVGGRRTIRLDVRVLGAANVDLPSLARGGAFRADLLDRLAFEVVTIPPLRARPADVMALANAFALEITRALGKGRLPRVQPPRGGAAARILVAGKRAGVEERRRAGGLSLGVIRCADRHGGHRSFRQPLASSPGIGRCRCRAAGRPPGGRKLPKPPAPSCLPALRSTSWPRSHDSSAACWNARSTRPGTTRARPRAPWDSGTTSSEGC